MGKHTIEKTGTPVLKERKRIASWWLRFEDLNWPNPDNHDRIKRRAEAMAKASVTTAMIFGTHFRWDFLLYFTILHDYLATVAEELSAYGVELYDHHSVNLIHRYSTREEMRHVILHSGPHLPFSPSFEAAATWEYNGSRLNDWRMIDVATRRPLWYPQYASEGFCIRNPQFVEAYRVYLQKLISETGIAGVSADDPLHYMRYRSCACPHCLAEFKRRTGEELPPVAERSFWGNWENPAWREWIDMRFDAAVDFFEALKPVFPKDFRVTTCGANSAAGTANNTASDARCFMAGCNYVNMEMSGNTPPYKKDPVTVNTPIASRLTGSSHHQAVARERDLRCFSTGFGFSEATANIVWALNKLLGADCWFSTLKDRLGLPESILRTLPDEADLVGRAFGFEKEHPTLFEGEPIGQLGVYFSYETRKHTYFGNLSNGYYKDYSTALKLLFDKGISPHTVFDFPKNATAYPVIVVPSAAVMTEKEQTAMDAYVKAGGQVIVTGPSAHPLCRNEWQLPTSPVLDTPDAFFGTIDHGVWYKAADWITKTTLAPSTEPNEWKMPQNGVHYNPHRISDGAITDTLLALVTRYMRPMPIQTVSTDGYLVTMFESADAITVHLLAEDFETDIDHHLDEIRFHRSRVNYIIKAEPTGVTDTLALQADTSPAVYTPFSEESAQTVWGNGKVTVHLPPKTAYVILQFPKK